MDCQQSLAEGPKIKGTFLVVPKLRIIVFWGLYWGPPVYGNYYERVSAFEEKVHRDWNRKTFQIGRSASAKV